MISSICPDCVTVAGFAKDHPKGTYVLACQNHVVAVDIEDIVAPGRIRSGVTGC